MIEEITRFVLLGILIIVGPLLITVVVATFFDKELRQRAQKIDREKQLEKRLRELNRGFDQWYRETYHKKTSP